ncbi:hypothetical protein ACBQ57_20805 [Escherichia coli]|uniref:hypothetical protein n=1 Tax=Escherichia coli TaxID=562 RepID=UPI0015D6BBCE|nr:hypothetical protein [Escherichia coli]MED8142855.1 hypothetical protein [Escherichia coli]NZD28987.1 hypothetical protein [Escherichia coli]HCO6421889.1 hypothetical protein [Escherichia coli]
MRKTISEFFHRLGISLSVLAFIAFSLCVYADSPDLFWTNVLIPLASGVFIYGLARFIGWVLNGLD